MKNKIFLTALLTGALSLSAAGVALADNPFLKRDAKLNLKEGQSVTLTGTVASVDGDALILNTRGEDVKIRFADWDKFNADKAFATGSKVTVSGVVDDHMIRGQEIKATTVYSADTGMRHSLNDLDRNNMRVTTVRERQVQDIQPAAGPAYFERTVTTSYSLPVERVEGTVTSIHGRTLNVTTPGGATSIDTLALGYDPTSQLVTPSIQVGDTIFLNTFRNNNGMLEASEVVSIKKPWQHAPIMGQRPTDKPGIRSAQNFD